MNERISLFDLIPLPFELYLRKHHLFLTFSSSESKKDGRVFQSPPFEQKDGRPPWTYP
jgi:hypothetical protein